MRLRDKMQKMRLVNQILKVMEIDRHRLSIAENEGGFHKGEHQGE